MDALVKWLIDLLLSPVVFVPLIFPGLFTATTIIIIIIWLERKIAGKVQLRYGPLYVTKHFGGVLQLLADLLRFAFAEIIVPSAVDKFTFIAGPALLLTAASLPLAVLPSGPEYYLFGDYGVLAALALLSLTPVAVMTLSWASNNKFALVGGVRECLLHLAYELPLFLAALAMVLLYGTPNLTVIAEQQAATWGAVLNPLAALAFFIATLMSTARFPFEISEAETEIVMGPYTEYSALLFGLTMAGSYIKLYVLSYLFAALFLGAWHPFGWLTSLYPALPGIAVLAKAFVVMAIAVFMRAVYPRLRIDQALEVGWTKVLALSLIAVVLSLALKVTEVV